jgi:hypothetical protein
MGLQELYEDVMKAEDDFKKQSSKLCTAEYNYDKSRQQLIKSLEIIPEQELSKIIQWSNQLNVNIDKYWDGTKRFYGHGLLPHKWLYDPKRLPVLNVRLCSSTRETLTPPVEIKLIFLKYNILWTVVPFDETNYDHNNT